MRLTGDLLHQYCDADPTPSGGEEAVLHGDVVSGDHGDDLDTGFGCGELGGHLEVHDVTGVVLHDVQDPRAGIDVLRRLQYLAGDRRGEHLARTGGIKHSGADEPAVQWFVTRTAPRDEPDLALDRGRTSVDDLVGVVDAQLRVGRRHAA